MRLAALVLAVGGLALHAAWRPRLEERQVALGLVLPAEGGRGMAADVAVPTLALGALRGLAVDWLWLRSLTLRDLGRHYEARQIAEQICRLQPRLPEAWAYLGHDLAYNTSAAVADAQQRWRWIQNGIELLRDQGLRHNPGDPDLIFMIARIYQDKLGSVTDDHHEEYKRLHARLMDAILGEAAPVQLAAADASLEAAAAADPAVAELVQALRAADLEPADALLPPPGAPDSPERAALLAERGASPAWARAALAVRRERLQAQGFDPALMVELDQRYGGLDWRSVDSATALWAERGLRALKGDPKLARKRWTLQRTVTAALKNAMRRGRVELLEDGGIYLAPMPDVVEPLDRTFTEVIAEAKRVAGDRPPGETATAEEVEVAEAAATLVNNQLGAREGFLNEACLLLAEYGRDAASRRLFAVAQRDYPAAPLFQQDYDSWLKGVMLERFAEPGTFDTPVGMRQLLEGSWLKAYRALAHGQDEQYAGLDRLARASIKRWDAWLRTQVAEEPDVFRRLGVDAETVRRRALHVAARGLTPGLRLRLSQRTGLSVEELLHPPEGDGAPR